MTKPTIEQITKLCFLQGKPCLHTYVHTLLTNEGTYLAALESICDSNIFSACSQAIKARVIAALHITKHHKALQKVLTHCEVVEIVKALSFLDRQRQIRQLERKIAHMEQAHPHLKEENVDGSDHRNDKEAKPPRKKRRKVDVFRTELQKLQDDEQDSKHNGHECAQGAHQNTAVQELIDSASVSGALARKIRQWAQQNLKADFLEFIVLADMPTTAWKKLADLVHFRPSDFALPYFLSFVHGEPLPEDSFVHALHALVRADTSVLASKFRALATEHPQVYRAFNFLRTQPRLLRNREIAQDLAQNIPLSTAIWYLEELALASSEIPALVGHRLKTEDWSQEHSKVTASFGKLLERVLTFQSRHWDALADDLVAAAEQRLAALKEVWSSEQQQHGTTTVVFGDASSSMTSAIQAATILATMISACLGAELSFFASDRVASPYPRPLTVPQTLQICRTIRASGCTSLAAALWPYYEQKKKMDRIVLVTDEEENTTAHGFYFAPLLQKYRNEIHPHVELIVICVNSGDERFRASLAKCGIVPKVMQIDGRRPDLTKFDAMLGQIALGSTASTRSKAEEDEEFVVV